MKYEIDEQLLAAIINYLSKRPFSEVSKHINKLNLKDRK